MSFSDKFYNKKPFLPKIRIISRPTHLTIMNEKFINKLASSLLLLVHTPFLYVTVVHFFIPVLFPITNIQFLYIFCALNGLLTYG